MKKYIILTFILIFGIANAQVKFSKRMKYSELASPEDKSLFLIDFWATWCAPCIHVSTYLNEIQKEFPDKLYIVSLTNESPDVVQKFLNRHHTSLAVSIDYDKENFNKYNVNALPYSVLLNDKGKIVWEGNPSNLTSTQIQYFLRKNKNTTPIYDFLKYEEYQFENQEDIKIDKDYNLQKLNKITEQPFSILKKGDYLIIEGTLSEILSYLLKINKLQLDFPDDNGDNYQLIINQKIQTNPTNLAQKLLDKQGLLYMKETKKGDIYTISEENPGLYWNTNQIIWGDENAVFLIDDQQFTADNVSLVDMIYQLSKLKKVLFIFNEKPNETIHDWEIHYKFDNLMESSLQNYGIHIEKSYGEYPIYKIKRIDKNISF